MFMSWLSYQDVNGDGGVVTEGQDSYQATAVQDCVSNICNHETTEYLEC